MTWYTLILLASETWFLQRAIGKTTITARLYNMHTYNDDIMQEVMHNNLLYNPQLCNISISWDGKGGSEARSECHIAIWSNATFGSGNDMSWMVEYCCLPAIGKKLSSSPSAT